MVRQATECTLGALKKGRRNNSSARAHARHTSVRLGRSVNLTVIPSASHFTLTNLWHRPTLTNFFRYLTTAPTPPFPPPTPQTLSLSLSVNSRLTESPHCKTSSLTLLSYPSPAPSPSPIPFHFYEEQEDITALIRQTDPVCRFALGSPLSSVQSNNCNLFCEGSSLTFTKCAKPHSAKSRDKG